VQNATRSARFGTETAALIVEELGRDAVGGGQSAGPAPNRRPGKRRNTLMDMNSRHNLRPEEASRAPLREETDLDRKYHRIGISAVAAAARYASGARNPGKPRAPSSEHEHAA
jgi:hypothetical protein